MSMNDTPMANDDNIILYNTLCILITKHDEATAFDK